MRNQKFRLSDMIPNSWFHKLTAKKTKTRDSPNPSKKYPSSSPKLSQKPNLSRPKQPYYYYSWESPRSKTHHDTKCHTSPTNLSLSGFDDHFPDLPRISISRRKTIYKPSPTSRQFRYDQSSFDLDCLCSRSPPPEFESDYSPELFTGIDSVSSSCSCGCNSNTISANVKQTNKRAARKHYSPSPGGIKLRKNTPRISIRKIQGQQQQRSSTNKKSVKKEGVFESMAVVKESDDPERDFRESMMEMIVENNIQASKDLEDLLACYLALNSNEYHQLIMNAFQHIWFKVPDFKM